MSKMLRYTEEQAAEHQRRVKSSNVLPEPVQKKATPQKPVKSGAAMQNLLETQIRLAGLADGCESEYKFHLTRRWRFDICWPAKKLALEIDGGNRMAVIGKNGTPFAVGRHTQDADMEKLNEAAVLGYVVMRFSPTMVKSGAAIAVISRAHR